MSPDRTAADKVIDVLSEKYGSKYDKALLWILKDRDVLLALYDLLTEHWSLVRTTNPNESAFATVPHELRSRSRQPARK